LGIYLKLVLKQQFVFNISDLISLSSVKFMQCSLLISCLLKARFHIVTCFVKLVSEVVFTQQRIWNFLGNRLVEVHVRCNAQATETEFLKVGISYVILP
jgi:hypothetical protein